MNYIVARVWVQVLEFYGKCNLYGIRRSKIYLSYCVSAVVFKKRNSGGATLKFPSRGGVDPHPNSQKLKFI